MSYPYQHNPGSYPPQNVYNQHQGPYAVPPSPAADDYQPDQHYPPYSSTDFISPERDGGGIAGGRQPATYPPMSIGADGLDAESVKYGAGAFEKSHLPVTRGSIAAQMAAEGQIPKKEGLRMWRKDEHAGALTRGGRARCCGRVLCCTIILVILIIVGIVRPPDVSFNGIEAPSSGSEVSVTTGGFDLNVRLNVSIPLLSLCPRIVLLLIECRVRADRRHQPELSVSSSSVASPRWLSTGIPNSGSLAVFGANFDRIDATAYYPTKPNTAVGGGSLSNVDIKKYSNTTIHFPFAINYTTSYDSDLSVLKDIATKCGFLGNSPSDLTVNYKVQTKVKVIAVKISPTSLCVRRSVFLSRQAVDERLTFSSSASFACPLSESDLSSFLGSSSLSSLLGGSSSRLRERSARPSQHGIASDVEAWQVGHAAKRALAVVVKRGMEVAGKEWNAGRRYRIGTVRPN
ncbi:SPOSA6832_01480, partial [Sporobolomyces salmonicolor]